MKNVVVPLELTPAAHAVLNAIAIEGGHNSVGQFILTVLESEVRAFGEMLADKTDPTLTQLFTPNR